jgi:hypothetical protein
LESIIGSFGEERQAAELIRRAKKRNRPMWWQSLIWLRWGIIRTILFLIVIYAILAARFYSARPSPRIDYVGELNRPLVNVPENDRAWPLYRQAILGMFQRDTDGQEPDLARDPPSWCGDNIDGKHWPEIQAWLRLHQADLELVRQAAARKVLGFVWGPRGSENDSELFRAATPRTSDNPIMESFYYLELSFYLRYAYYLADILQADAKLAGLDQDSDRLERDVTSLHHLADQLRDTKHGLTDDVMALIVDSDALASLDRVISLQPQLLGDEQLIRLSHELAGPKTAGDLIHIRNDHSMMEDAMQRMFSDDGKRNGRITAKGVTPIMIAAKGLSGIRVENYSDNLALFLGPIVSPFVASRGEMMNRYERLMEVNEADLRLTLRSVHQPAVQQLLAEAQALTEPEYKYGLLSFLEPGLMKNPGPPEQYLGRRDGLLTAMALELYHRHNGDYPKSLSELKPTFLSEIPVDRFTGEPIKYRLINSRPLLYSVGADLIDDGGTPPPGDPLKAANWTIAPKEAPRGDWILYPQPKMTAGDD